MQLISRGLPLLLIEAGFQHTSETKDQDQRKLTAVNLSKCMDASEKVRISMNTKCQTIQITMIGTISLLKILASSGTCQTMMKQSITISKMSS